MAALPYMQFHIAEYLADTSHLSTEEHGAYLLLIFNYWQRGKPLDNTGGRLSNVVRMSNERWAEVQIALREYFSIDDEIWTHHRIDRDLGAVIAKCEQSRHAGRLSGERRRNDRSATVGTTVHTTVPTERQREANDKKRVLKEEKREEETKDPETPPRPILFDSAMVATAVMTECRLSGMKVKMAIEQIARYEIAEGVEGLTLVAPMCEAWATFVAAKPNLEYAWGAEKFFGEGNWKNQAGWPWRKNGADRKHFNKWDAMRDEIAAEAEDSH